MSHDLQNYVSAIAEHDMNAQTTIYAEAAF